LADISLFLPLRSGGRIARVAATGDHAERV